MPTPELPIELTQIDGDKRVALLASQITSVVDLGTHRVIHAVQAPYVSVVTESYEDVMTTWRDALSA